MNALHRPRLIIGTPLVARYNDTKATESSVANKHLSGNFDCKYGIFPGPGPGSECTSMQLNNLP
jgi:hypothetical protein